MSIMKKKMMHFDMDDGKVNFDLTFYQARLKHFGQSYNSKIEFKTPLRNVSSVTLHNIEIPFLAFNVRSENSSNRFRIQIFKNTTRYFIDIVIPEKNHTSIGTLISDINASILVETSKPTISAEGIIIVLMLDPSDTTRVMFKSNADPNSVLFSDFLFTDASPSFDPIGDYTTPLLKMLGFCPIYPSDQSVRNVDGFSYMRMSDRYQLNNDTYFNMTLSNLNVDQTNMFRPCTFRIPLNVNFGEIAFLQDLKQTVYFDRKDTVLSSLNVVITDKYGSLVYSNGSTISFTLLIEYTD